MNGSNCYQELPLGCGPGERGAPGRVDLKGPCSGSCAGGFLHGLSSFEGHIPKLACRLCHQDPHGAGRWGHASPTGADSTFLSVESDNDSAKASWLRAGWSSPCWCPSASEDSPCVLTCVHEIWGRLHVQGPRLPSFSCAFSGNTSSYKRAVAS